MDEEAVQLWMAFFLLALFRQIYLRTLMISQFFVSHRLDIKSVKKAVARYEQIAGAKTNFDKNEGLRLGAYRDGVLCLNIFRWSDGSTRILGV